MNKEMALQELVGELRDGMTIGIGGWGPRRKPMALIREILKSDLKDLTVVAYGGADVGMLCAAGKVKKVVFAFVSLDFIPLEPYFRQARQNGDIEVMEIDEGMMLLGLRAAAWGCPFIPSKLGLGTDVVKHNPEIKLIDSPYDDKEWLAMPALKLDAALIHVDRADRRGVCQIKGPDIYMDDWMARAADKTFVSCEELVDTDYFAEGDEARYVFWERTMTLALTPVPVRRSTVSMCRTSRSTTAQPKKAASRPTSTSTSRAAARRNTRTPWADWMPFANCQCLFTEIGLRNFL